MKKLIKFLPFFLLLFALLPAMSVKAWQFNGISPASTGSATPVTIGSTTPVAIATCSTTNVFYMDVQVKGGTAGTDGCYMLPSGVASPCAAASPAPSSASLVGYFLPSGGADYAHTVINFPSAGGWNILNSEWDAVCTVSETVSVTKIP